MMDQRRPIPWTTSSRRISHRRHGVLTPWIALGALVLALPFGAAVTHAAAPGGPVLVEPEPPYVGGIDNIREFGTARSDHEQIVLAIAQCHDFADLRTWNAQVRAVFMLGLNERLGHTISLEESNEPRKMLAPNQYQRAAISFSDKLSRERLYYRDMLERSRLRATALQWLIIGAGGVATVLVGIKAIWPGDKWRGLGVAIGIAALIASATSTAMTSMDSFYGSKDEVVRDARTLAQLQQLHWRIVSDVMSTRNLCSDLPAKEQQDRVNAWKERLEQVLNEAMPSFAKPGDVRIGPSAPNPDKPPNPGGSQASLAQERQ
jgi:hypothetical protein